VARIDGSRRWLALLAGVLGAILVSSVPVATGASRASTAGATSACVYSDHSIATLESFTRLTGVPISCASVFNDSAPDWSEWERPWFLGTVVPDHQWLAWQRSAPGRRIVVTQGLVPQNELARDWRAAGARGTFDAHFVALGTALVAAGLQNATIRLGAEANDPGNSFSLGRTDRDRANWVAFWRRAARALRSVPGSAFQLDWTVNAHWRPTELIRFYPGDSSVDIVGIDAYDWGGWQTVASGTDGVDEVARFAAAHGKPLSIPEWGLVPVGAGGAGDDPGYVSGIASALSSGRGSYQTYFFTREYADTLLGAPASVAAYRVAFGA
jgi:hypothetical protein